MLYLTLNELNYDENAILFIDKQRGYFPLLRIYGAYS